MHTHLMRTIKAERLKLKRSPVWLAFFALPVLSAFFGTNNYLANQGVLQNEWFSLWSQHSLFLCFIFMPALISTFCSYLWRLEHLRNNWNSFLTAPVPISILYLGKLTQAVRVTILGNLWIFLLYYVCGKFARIPSSFPWEALSWFLCGTLGAVVVCCVQLLLSLLIRSFAIPIGIALAGGIFGLFMTNRNYGMNYPYSLYCMGMRANNPYMEIHISTLLVNSIGYILLFAALSIFYLRKHERSAG